MKTYPNASIGKNSIIEENVIVGMQYHPDCGIAQIGDNAIIRAGTIIYGDVKIGNYFQTGHYAVIRSRVEMGDYCTVFNGAVIEGMVKLGSGVRLMTHCYVSSRTVIGNRVVCGPNVVFLNEKRPGRAEEETKGAYVEDDVMIGGGSLILPGVRIGEGSFIAAGSVVTKDVPPHSMVMGFPARFSPLPAELDVPCRPEMAYQKTDLWHPDGPNPFLADWPEGYGEPPIPKAMCK